MTRLSTRYRHVLCATALVVALACSSNVAYAADECGAAVGVPATATCTIAGNPYSNGIQYSAAGDLLLNIDPGVVVDVTGLGVGHGIFVQSPGGAATLVAPNVTIDLTNDPTTGVHNGLLAITAGAGDAVVNAGGVIDVAGTNDNLAASAFAYGNGQALVTWAGPISITGGDSAGLYAGSFGTGDSVIDGSGDITGVVTAPRSFMGGIFAAPVGSGDALVRYRSGTVHVTGPFAYGVAATSYGSGSAQVITDPGTVIIVTGEPDANQNGYVAVNARTFGGSAAAGNFVLADIASLIQTTGGAIPNPTAAFNPIGIRARSEGDVPVTVNYSGLGITTVGGGGVGIYAVSGFGDVTVDSSGPITTSGTIAHGIFAGSGIAPRATLSELAFPVLVPLEGTEGTAAGFGGALLVTSTNSISTNGLEAHGIFAASASGPVTVNADDTSAIGEFSAGVIATGSSVEVNVAQGAVVAGGWQADPTTVGDAFHLPSAGIIIGASSPPVQETPTDVVSVAAIPTATINIDGTVGALSDRAIAEAELFNDRFGAETLTINNDGTVIGYLQFGSGDAFFHNNSFNSLDLRDFEDTDADGIRDTERVAVSDFGGGFDQFDNNATGAVRLLSVFGATTVDTTGQILPGGFGIHSIAPGGVEQGQMINLELFENRGLITMQDEETGGAFPIAGDVLVITGSDVAGFSGGGVFLSDGGALHIDTVLNQGSLASISDTLVVDTTDVGPGGATRISVANAGGLGAPTIGDGIKVVDVLEPGNSAAGAFALEGRAVAGAFDYFLFQGGVLDPTDGDWYLRDELRPEVGAYLANIRGTATMFVHTLHERLGEPQFAEDTNHSKSNGVGSVWLRTVGRWVDVDPDGSSPFTTSTDTWLVQGGMEFAEWSLFNGAGDRVHFGGMFGYGEADSDASALNNPYRATADANGFSLGGYATWYRNDKTRVGPYADFWLQYGTFDNNVSGDLLPVDSYDSDVFTTSLEGGWAFLLDPADPFMLEPQAQLVYLSFNQDDLTERNATFISGSGDMWMSRLGMRAHGTWLSGRTKYQPYFEANWWHDFEEETVAFNGLSFSGGMPENRGEVGLGLDVELSKHTTLWANAEYQFGDNYEGVEGLLGAKYAW